MAKVLDFELLGIHIQKVCISNQPIKGEGYSAKAKGKEKDWLR